MAGAVQTIDSLTELQRNFVREYIIDFKPGDAHERAGYEDPRHQEAAIKLLNLPKIKHAINRAIEESRSSSPVTEEWLVDALRETVERCRQVEPVLDRNGNPVFITTRAGQIAAAFTFNASGVYEGLKLLGRHIGAAGMTSDSGKGDVNVNVNIRTFDDEEKPGMKDVTKKPPVIEAQVEETHDVKP